MRLLFRIIDLVKGLIAAIRARVAAFDKMMRRRYRPDLMAAVVLAIIAVLIAVPLFVPPYMGMSNDGGFDNVLADVGLQRVTPDDATAYFSYYERTYYIESNAAPPGVTPVVLSAVVRAAISLDTLFTHDTVFDVRFLAAIYFVLYLLALYPLLRTAMRKIAYFSEAILLGIAAVLIFAETTIAVNFASFYTQPMETILLLTITDAAAAAGEKHGTGFGPAILAIAAALLVLLNPYCCLIGVVIAVALWLLAGNRGASGTDRPPVANRAACIMLALALTVLSVFSTAGMVESRTSEQRYDQMTRGVLFQAEDPEEALAFFKIDPRYTVLTETYADQQYPIASVKSGVLDKGFLDRYTTSDVLLYYGLHPTALFSLMDLGVRNAFVTRSDFSGNYEQSLGLPPRAKALFVSVWSTFKEQSAPKTVGTLIVIMGLLAIMRRRKKADEKHNKLRKQRLLGWIMTDMVLVAVCIEILTVVVMTGDAELIRESHLMGCMIDILVLYFLGEAMYRPAAADEQGSVTAS